MIIIVTRYLFEDCLWAACCPRPATDYCTSSSQTHKGVLLDKHHNIVNPFASSKLSLTHRARAKAGSWSRRSCRMQSWLCTPASSQTACTHPWRSSYKYTAGDHRTVMIRAMNEMTPYCYSSGVPHTHYRTDSCEIDCP